YPALAIARALSEREPRLRFTFFATHRPIDRRVLDRGDWELVPQTLPPLRAAPWGWPGVIRGYRGSSRACRLRFDRDRPLVVVGTGGFASVPAVRMARRAGIATALLNPDAIPGRANRLLAADADAVFVQWPETADHFRPGTAVRVAGCPVRAAFNTPDRQAGISRFSLDPKRKTLLVTGASQGARSINEAMITNVDLLRARDGWQVLHLTGDADHASVRRAYAAAATVGPGTGSHRERAGDPRRGDTVRFRVLPYTDHMADALAASDLVVSRAGASTLAEITAVGRAAILMPYPYHRDMHQLANARRLVRAAAARIVFDTVDPARTGRMLRAVLEELMTDDDARDHAAAAARRIGRGSAAADIAGQLLALRPHGGAEGGCESLEPARDPARS
ncbi:MAG: glycosyltransferase, partial [Phycisphaerae bacterium]